MPNAFEVTPTAVISTGPITYPGTVPLSPSALSYDPTSLGNGDGSNFFCKRLPSGFVKDERRLATRAIDGSITINGPITIEVIEQLDKIFGVIYTPGRVDTYSTQWSLCMSCKPVLPARTPGTRKSTQTFTGPAISSTPRPQPFATEGAIQTFCQPCAEIFFAESCVDIFGQQYRNLGTPEQGRWMFCGAGDSETGSITYPPIPGIGESQELGDSEWIPHFPPGEG